MGAFDISRNAFHPAKHYASVRMQQGRVLTDDDWNENERIENEERRRALTDIVGAYGSPDMGFKIAHLTWANRVVDFDILPGTLYLGGLRLEMDLAPRIGNPPESLELQRDYLTRVQGSYQTPLAGDLASPRYDMVYLEAWQQGVSAVEDNELFEAALAGPDTTTRVRYMRRVHVAQNLGFSSCPQDWAALRAAWEADHLGIVNKEMERVVNTKLQVGFTEEGVGDDLCAPSVAGSYLGAENQAIRVQIVDGTHFTWGFDNASPYYRVQLSGGALDSVTMQDLPKDQYHWPVAGQTVEILPWSALLPNGEKVAEVMGHLTTITNSYSPGTNLNLAAGVPANLNAAWVGRLDQPAIDNDGDDTFVYMRIWNRGSDVISTAQLIIQPGPNILGNTGLTVTFTGTDRVAGDFWVIAARPETPEEIVPWRLQHEGIAPHGIRRFFAPLAVIKWSLGVNQDVVGEIIHDCRKTFRPLTDLESCCTFHVGDGVHSFGDFNTIAEALANLPEWGGKICVLNGFHRANLDIIERVNVTIHGCGIMSIVIPEQGKLDRPIIRIARSRLITIEGLTLFAPLDRAILLYDGAQGFASNTINIERNLILGVRNGIFIHTNDLSPGDNSINISNNVVAVPNVPQAGVGIYCLADGVLIERNKVVVVPAPILTDGGPPPGGILPDPCECECEDDEDPNAQISNYVEGSFASVHNLWNITFATSFLALGGIQIGGSSERVLIWENLIVGGAGNGITLGHVPTIFDFNSQADLAWTQRLEDIGRYAMTTCDFDMTTVQSSEGGELGRVFKGVLYDIHIDRNVVAWMGMAGVGVICFFYGAQNPSEIPVIIVNNLKLTGNEISRCAIQIPAQTRSTGLHGYGGVVLAELEEAVIEDNQIQDCGRSSLEPICGIYIMSGEKFAISRNRILNNGPEIANTPGNGNNSAGTRVGSRGGIYIAFAVRTNASDILMGQIMSDGIPAVQILDNIVVQPLGQALYLMCMGPAQVVGNNFTTQDQDPLNASGVLAATVFIVNLGVSKDYARLLFEPTLANITNPSSSGNNALLAANLISIGLGYLPSGQVMFNDNQVTLDQRNLELDISLSSVSILTLDDLSFVSNQLECLGLALVVAQQQQDQDSVQLLPIDYSLTDALLVAASLRTADNRFQEGFVGTVYSLFSMGSANTTTGNQSSHCMHTFGTREVFENNIEGILDNGDCGESRIGIGKANGYRGMVKKPASDYNTVKF